jgi:hypothetical protein
MSQFNIFFKSTQNLYALNFIHKRDLIKIGMPINHNKTP